MGAWIGTSGWSYGHWKDVLYPPDLPQTRWLEHYAGHFNSVELNASFYHLPKEATFAQWRERTPDGFCFAVKASRFITHTRRLADCAEPLERFFGAAARLEEKLAAVLFQLPASFEKDIELLAAFLGEARRAAPAAARFAFEFRSESWLAADSYGVLKKHRTALVFADWGALSPMGPVTADFVYLRRHGPKSDYASPYSAEDIRRDARAAKAWLAGGLDLFAYYNNDFGGHAVRDARSLADAVKG